MSTTTFSSSFQICFPLFSSLSVSVIVKEVEEQWDIMWEDVGCVGVTARFITPRCSNRGGEVDGLHRCGKKAQ